VSLHHRGPQGLAGREAKGSEQNAGVGHQIEKTRPDKDSDDDFVKQINEIING